MKAAAHRNDIAMNKAKAAAAASDVSRNVVAVNSLKSSIMRANMERLVHINDSCRETPTPGVYRRHVAPIRKPRPTARPTVASGRCVMMSSSDSSIE